MTWTHLLATVVGCSAYAFGLMLGVRFPDNFDMPYRATDLSALWRRWHITLSQLIRDYLYIPLGGSRCSRLFTSLGRLGGCRAPVLAAGHRGLAARPAHRRHVPDRVRRRKDV